MKQQVNTQTNMPRRDGFYHLFLRIKRLKQTT